MHVRKGDSVVVIAGKEKGKRGRVLRLLTSAGRVVIERVNMVKRHTKPTQRNPRGGIRTTYVDVPTAKYTISWQSTNATSVRSSLPRRSM